MAFEKLKNKMGTMFQSSKKKVLAISAVTGAFLLNAKNAVAVPLIENDTLDGLSEMGTEIGSFLGNLVPGLFKFLILMAIAAGIVLIFRAIFKKITQKM